MLAQVTIRTTRPDDAPGLHAAIDAVARERKYLGMVEAPSLQDIVVFISLPSVAQVVAIDGGVIVGWADVNRRKGSSFEHRGVLGMGVVRTHRRRGIGMQLLAAVTSEARRLGVRRLELEVFGSNLAAVALYQHAGFELEGELLGARLLDGVSDDILLMRRWLDASATADGARHP